jgi:C-terminal processing protease CtpA/Prc
MKSRLIFTLMILAVAATSALGQAKQRKTFFIQDGKLLEDGRLLDMENLLGGKRAFLGVSLSDITPELREYFGGSKEAGVLVGSVEAGSPADKAGFRVGDVIVSIDGKEVSSSWELRSSLRTKKEGDSVRVDIIRGRDRHTLVASVVERELPYRIALGDLPTRVGETFNSPEWRARIETFQNCDELQAKLKQLETRMKELEKKLK